MNVILKRIQWQQGAENEPEFESFPEVSDIFVNTKYNVIVLTFYSRIPLQNIDSITQEFDCADFIIYKVI